MLRHRVFLQVRGLRFGSRGLKKRRGVTCWVDVTGVGGMGNLRCSSCGETSESSCCRFASWRAEMLIRL